MAYEFFDLDNLKNRMTSFSKAHFSWKFFRSVLSAREVIFPITIQKPFWWGFYSLILGGLITTQATVGLVEYLYYAVNSNIIALAMFLFFVEPTYFLFMMLFSKYPKADLKYLNQSVESSSIEANTYLEAPQVDLERQQHFDFDVSVIIACHKSQDNIQNTLNAWLRIVPGRRIYVVDNGNPPYPKDVNGKAIDNTKSIVQTINRQINYVFSDHGNKTYALYLGALKANTKYVIICDDDIIPPPNVLDALSLFDEHHDAVVLPLKAIHKTNHGNLLTDWQNLEYCLADHAKNYEDRSCGPTRPHGACSVWNRQFMLDILFKHHDTRFIGEDLKMGLRTLYERSRFRYGHNLYVQTYVPNSLFGPMPNYYTQRVRIWEMGRHIYWPMVLFYIITTWQKSSNPLKTIRDNIVLKIEQSYFIYQVVADWLRLPVLLLSANNWRYWAVSSASYGLLVAGLLIWNYVKLMNHPQEKHKLFTILTYPVYKIIYKSFSVLAFFRALFIFIPNYSSLVRIDQLEKKRADIEAARTSFIEYQSALVAMSRPFNWAEYVTNLLMTEAQRARETRLPALPVPTYNFLQIMPPQVNQHMVLETQRSAQVLVRPLYESKYGDHNSILVAQDIPHYIYDHPIV